MKFLITSLLALLALFAVGAARASTVTLSTGAQCTYTSAVIDGAGNLAVACAGAITQPPPPPPPPPPPVPAGCGASYSSSFTMNAQKMVFPLAQGQTAAIAFTPQAGQQLQFSTTDTTSTPQDASHTVAISTCAGDVFKPWPCSYSANFVGSTLNASGGAGPPYVCQLQPGTPYYMNVLMETCAEGSCPIRVQIQGYQ